MNEREWQDGFDAASMLRHLSRKGAEPLLRKRRLFGIACCRRIWDLIDNESCRRAVEVSERYADGRSKQETLDRARQRAFRALDRYEQRHLPEDVAIGDHIGACAVRAGAYSAYSDDWTGQVYNPWEKLGIVVYYAQRAAREEFAAELLRDVVGNPFRKVRFERKWSEWNDGAAAALARSMYDESDFSRMPDLGDLLEAAGCRDKALLGHCRRDGRHVKGCWVVDVVLGK